MSPSASLGAAAVACIPIYYSRTGTERDRDGLTISMGQCKSVHALQDGDALRSARERGAPRGPLREFHGGRRFVGALVPFGHPAPRSCLLESTTRDRRCKLSLIRVVARRTPGPRTYRAAAAARASHAQRGAAPTRGRFAAARASSRSMARASSRSMVRMVSMVTCSAPPLPPQAGWLPLIGWQFIARRDA